MTQPDADRWISTTRNAHDRIVAQVRDLDHAQLTGPSGCSEWDVAQVLGHLGSGSELNLATLQAGRQGVPGPGAEAHPPVWERWDALGPEAKRDGFIEHGERLVAELESLSPEERTDVRVDVFYLPEPIDIARSTSFRLSELALHGWDVTMPFDAAAAVPADEADLLLGRVPELIGFFGKADALAAPVSLRVEATDPDRAFGLSITDTVAVGEAPAAADADGVLRIPAEAWLRLVSGRLAAAHTPASTHLDAAGVTLDDLRRVFPGY